MHALNYAVLAAYLGLMLAIGFYFSRQQHSSRDFFLAGRSMGWFPIGLSVMATLLSALSYSGVPGEAYWQGCKHLLLPASVWLAAPLMWKCFLPLYRGLRMYSVYEYLELRYDWSTRLVSSFAFIFWRLLWLGGVLYAPVKVLVVAAGLTVPEWLLLVALGLVGTAYTFLGGMKAVIWTDVIQAIVMGLGVVLIVGGVWWQLEGGAAEVWQRAADLHRTQLVDASFDWNQRWSVWGMAPHMLLSMLSFYIADQITVQRFLTARTIRAAQHSFLLNCLSVTVMIPALMYVGLCLLAFYQAFPQQMRPIWLANVDNVVDRQSLVDPQSGQPYLSWEEGRSLDGRLDQPALDELVASQRLFKPNSKQPFEDTQGLIEPSSGLLDARRIGMRSRDGEWILNQRAKDELLPRFIANHLPLGVAGVILAALLAASMSSMDSGLNSICTLLITDLHRRLGWGRSWLSRRTGKHAEALGEDDELRLARPLVLVIGVAATLFSLVIGQLGGIFDIMIGVVNTFGGPLMAIFVLGVFTRRTTAKAALTALVAGLLYTISLLGANHGWPLFSSISDPLNSLGIASCLAALALAGACWAYRLAEQFRLGRGGGSALAGIMAFVIVLATLSIWPAAESSEAANSSLFPCFGVERVSSIWLVTFGSAFTISLGAALSCVLGRAKSDEQLRGLVVGLGQLGVREPEEAHIAIPDIELPEN